MRVADGGDLATRSLRPRRRRRSRRRDRPSSPACSRRGCRSAPVRRLTSRSSTALRVSPRAAVGSAVFARRSRRGRLGRGMAAGTVRRRRCALRRWRCAAITCAAESASANCSGKLLLGGEPAREVDVESGEFAVGPGKVERRTRANEDDELLRLLRRRQGPGTAHDREQGRCATATARPARSSEGSGATDALSVGWRWRHGRGDDGDATDYSGSACAGAPRHARAAARRLPQGRRSPIIRSLRRMRNRSTAGRPALQRREPGQVRKEAATAINCKCRGNGSPPLCPLAHERPQGRRQGAHELRSRDGARLRSAKGAPMSYQVLARKWRPKTFAELVGQEHVVTALTNALDAQPAASRLPADRHARRRQDDDRAASSRRASTASPTASPRRPAARCAACIDIDAGRFVDLLELDAASNTGIDNMREILDNARYAPTVGRYKVYLIDEVHMLSKAAFNSMLKTLEEPPEHVKFVLATTDPQKIPVTVLSRCLQFNLKQLPPALIAERLARDPRGGGHRVRRAGAGADRARRARFDARRAVAARPGDRLRRRRGARGRRCARCSAPSTPSTSTGSSMRSSPSDGPALLAEVDAMASAQHRVRVGARRARVALPSDRRGAGGAGGGGRDGRRRARARASPRGSRRRCRPARLPDLRAGPRRPAAGARTRRRAFR